LLAESAYMIVFRIVHIVSAVLWMGGAVLVNVYVGPTAGELGPAAFPVMKHLVEQRKITTFFKVVSSATVLGGLFLYWHDWHAYGSFGNWLSHPFGVAITIGAVSAIIAWFIGNYGIGKSVEQLVEVGNRVAAAAAGPPSQEQVATMDRLGARLKTAGQADLLFLGIAVLAMATARYW
jgi:uncharacterized membrane protein